MLEFTAPAALDGKQLMTELSAAGYTVFELYLAGTVLSFEAKKGDGTEATEADRTAIQAVLNAHKGTPLATIKEQALEKVDREAENYRLKYVTSGEAMQSVYRLKNDEVKLYREDEAKLSIDTTGARYPVINSEVGITASTLGEVVTLVEKRIADWTAIAAATEALRQKAKKDIKTATTVEGVRAAANVAWP